MFRSRRLPSSPDEIYSSSLASFYEGHALWYPEPHVSGEPQIGDVGYILRGAFIRLFNLDTSSAEKKVTFWPVAFEDIEPLPPNVLQIDRRERPLVPDHYCSHGMESNQIQVTANATAGPNVSLTLTAAYTCKATQGAVLALKSEAHTETLFESQVLEKYIVRNHDKWYAYVTDVLGHRLKQEDLIVVRGWVKTEADWATAAFSNVSMSSSVSLEGNAGNAAGVGVSGSRTRSVTGPRAQRQGRSYLMDASRPRPAELTRDQSVFIKRYKILKRLGFLKKIIAGAGHHRLSDAGDGRSGSGGEGVTAQEEDLVDMSIPGFEDDGEVSDPLDILLDYMLETTDAETVIASDDDVGSIVGSNHVVDFASYLRRVEPPVQVDGTLGLICTEDVIRHERKRALAPRAIRPNDLAEWPGITMDDAGCLSDRRVFIGPTEDDSRPMKLRQPIFVDSQNPFTPCECFSLSIDGELMAASFESNDILVWRLSDGLLVRRLNHQGYTEPVRSLAFSPDNRSLVSGSRDATVVAWDIQHGHPLLRLEGHRGTVQKVVYASDGTLIATASNSDESVKVWDALSGACLHSFDVHGSIYQVSFSPDHSRIYIGVHDSCLIYETQTFARIAGICHRDGEGYEWSISRQGDRIATGLAANDRLKIWSAATGEELLTISHQRELSCPVAFSPDGAELLAACDADKTAVTFDSRTGQLRRAYNLSGILYHVSYSRGGEYVALDDKVGNLRVYDAKSGAFLARFQGLHDENYTSIPQFLFGGQSLVARFSDGLSLLHNVRDIVRMR